MMAVRLNNFWKMLVLIVHTAVFSYIATMHFFLFTCRAHGSGRVCRRDDETSIFGWRDLGTPTARVHFKLLHVGAARTSKSGMLDGLHISRSCIGRQVPRQTLSSAHDERRWIDEQSYHSVSTYLQSIVNNIINITLAFSPGYVAPCQGQGRCRGYP